MGLFSRKRDRTEEGWPRAFWYTPTVPDGSLALFPVPAGGTVASVALYVAAPQGEPTTLDTSLVLPEGAFEAVLYGLAVRLAPSYGKQPDAVTVALAQEALGAWKRPNIRELHLEVDAALLPTGGGFNIYSGE